MGPTTATTKSKELLDLTKELLHHIMGYLEAVTALDKKELSIASGSELNVLECQRKNNQFVYEGPREIGEFPMCEG